TLPGINPEIDPSRRPPQLGRRFGIRDEAANGTIRAAEHRFELGIGTRQRHGTAPPHILLTPGPAGRAPRRSPRSSTSAGRFASETAQSGPPAAPAHRGVARPGPSPGRWSAIPRRIRRSRAGAPRTAAASSAEYAAGPASGAPRGRQPPYAAAAT